MSSFGIGGTNAHAILEEWNQAICLDSSTGFYSLILSARTLTALKMIARKLGQHLQKYPELSLANVAYTLHVGRRSFEHTRVLVCRDREEAISLLEHFDPANYLPTPELPKENLYEDNSYHRVPLPTYPFEKKRYWVDPPTATLKESVAGLSQHPSVEDALINTWRECLGVKSISIHDDFFRLGGDSLLAIEMAARLSKQFGLPFSMQMLITYPTVAQLSRVILEEKSKLTSLPSLIQLKAGSLASPLFFIHPIEGNLFCYQDLVAGLTCQNPIYGIQAVDEKFKSIEEIATDYIQELRRVQPNGYYYLLGMSFGGIVAYEMARQLKAGGSSVALLCMLDAGNPDPFFTSLSSEEERLAYLAELLEVNPMPGMQCTADKVISRLGLGTLPSKEQEIIFDGVKARLLALANYRPKPYDGKILFFEAIKKTPANRNLSSGSSWKALVKDRIEIQEVSGTHVSMLMQPQVNELISFLERRLTEGYGECQKT